MQLPWKKHKPETSEKEPQPNTESKTAATGDLRQEIINMLKTVYDPEIPVDIYELGLIYEIRIADDQSVDVLMTLTSPSCPVAGSLPVEVEEKVKQVPGVTGAHVELTFDPPWNQDMMSEEAKLELNMF